MTALALNSTGKVEDRLKWIFSAYDLDNNNFVDKNEFKTIIKVFDLIPCLTIFSI